MHSGGAWSFPEFQKFLTEDIESSQLLRRTHLTSS